MEEDAARLNFIIEIYKARLALAKAHAIIIPEKLSAKEAEDFIVILREFGKQISSLERAIVALKT